MSRFDLDLAAISDERTLVPVGVYEARIVKGELRSGETEKGKWANISLTLAINDLEVAKAMNQDEPKVFWSGMLAFDKDTGKFDKNNCPDIGQFTKATGFTDISDFEDGVEEIEDDYEAWLKIFSNIAAASVGTDLICKVVQQPHYQDRERMVNDVSSLAKLEG